MGSVVGSYQIIKTLGEGGMGAVYLAQHSLLRRHAALKMLLPALSMRPDVVNRFFNEARATTSISDPGIVQIFDFGYHVDGSAYIVMEYLEGEPLDARLARLGRMPVVDALRLVRQLATSLAAAHAQRIIHRDLKPENIYLVRDPEVASGERPKLLDFGIAKLSDEHPGKLKTHTGALMGTPAYMSPEQCRGASELDHRADIYSLGCVLFHLISGTPPFDGDGIGDIIAAHLREPAPVLSSRVGGITPSVDAIVAGCLAKRPEERFQTMLELAASIGRALPHPSYSGSMGAPTQLAAPGPVGGRLTPPPGTKNASPTGAPPHTSMPIPGRSGLDRASTPTTLGSGSGLAVSPTRQARWILPLLALLVLGGVVLTAVSVLGGGQGDSHAATAPQPSAAIPAPALADAATPVSQAASDAAAASAATAVNAPSEPAAVEHAGALAKPDPSGAHARGVRGEIAGDKAEPHAIEIRSDPVPVKRTRSRKAAGSAKASSEACDRRVDEDCDGIPDVR